MLRKGARPEPGKVGARAGFPAKGWGSARALGLTQKQASLHQGLQCLQHPVTPPAPDRAGHHDRVATLLCADPDRRAARRSHSLRFPGSN